jgi:hypothetical protein
MMHKEIRATIILELWNLLNGLIVISPSSN